MLLSNYLLSGGVKPYLEYGWVTAPNAARQSISANTITTLTIDTEVADTGNNGSISGNQITLNAGTYYFKLSAYIFSLASNDVHTILSLYNVSDNQYISKSALTQAGSSTYNAAPQLDGQFTIASSKVFDIRLITNGSSNNGSGGFTQFTLSTAGADQRTTIKLWKLA